MIAAVIRRRSYVKRGQLDLSHQWRFAWPRPYLALTVRHEACPVLSKAWPKAVVEWHMVIPLTSTFRLPGEEKTLLGWVICMGPAPGTKFALCSGYWARPSHHTKHTPPPEVAHFFGVSWPRSGSLPITASYKRPSAGAPVQSVGGEVTTRTYISGLVSLMKSLVRSLPPYSKTLCRITQLR